MKNVVYFFATNGQIWPLWIFFRGKGQKCQKAVVFAKNGQNAVEFFSINLHHLWIRVGVVRALDLSIESRKGLDPTLIFWGYELFGINFEVSSHKLDFCSKFYFIIYYFFLMLFSFKKMQKSCHLDPERPKVAS